MEKRIFRRVKLEKDCSLAHWMQYISTLPDQSKNEPIYVTAKVLKEHSSESDLWVLLNGKVYDVTSYLRFHPGGKDSILSVAGRDATSLFNEFHAWVNYEALLGRCCIGQFVGPRP
ncbi:cytochrome b5 reductase 4 [Trichuris trichiura]|uniref:Cytochrome b5 reductase 4 n=1 Tax=Trichuris trichiura TaxID=36087 RepID=A0A077Z9C2_TRITR|nr:cytochrome b5 reductase 4 [Trichuris trichiura]